MNVNLILFLLLAGLMCFIGKEKGRLALFALFLNLFFLFLMLLFINWGFPPIPMTLIVSLIITALNLFFINGSNTKTMIAFFSSFLVLLLLLVLIFLSVNSMHLQGLPMEELMEMDMYSLNIGISFLSLSISVMIMSAVGAINDIAISMTSAIDEIHRTNSELTKSDLFNSGVTIGKDILSSTMNTVIFALVGGQLALFIWVSDLNYTLSQFFNSKILVFEWVSLLLSGIAIILTIPISAYLMVLYLKKK
ncbi:YibE/F family protein [Vagococcus hydrophili]|uniref:YibE/F family protein n=1 Tax=Vagococcus hydrophili TaxID=2714947 RepID=A0A6G8AQC5_9ENTE|nr:YibE/F family protein [Vagococcus hydrophili]QIL47142.1 YibE/F family protein [Vagococcus hydrophili]